MPRGCLRASLITFPRLLLPFHRQLNAALVVLDAQLTAAGVPAPRPQMAGGGAKADSILSQMPLPPTETPQRRGAGAGRPPDRP